MPHLFPDTQAEVADGFMLVLDVLAQMLSTVCALYKTMRGRDSISALRVLCTHV